MFVNVGPAASNEGAPNEPGDVDCAHTRYLQMRRVPRFPTPSSASPLSTSRPRAYPPLHSLSCMMPACLLLLVADCSLRTCAPPVAVAVSVVCCSADESADTKALENLLAKYREKFGDL